MFREFNEDGFLFDPSASGWPSPPLGPEVGHGSPSYSDKGTSHGAQTIVNHVFSLSAMLNDTWTTATSSPCSSRPATYHHPALLQLALSWGPPQGAAGKHLYILYFPISYCDVYQARDHYRRSPDILQHAGLWVIHISHPATFYILLTRSNTSPGHALFKTLHILTRSYHCPLRYLIPRLANAPLLLNQRTAWSKRESLNSRDAG
jgi:hypothetical protein